MTTKIDTTLITRTAFCAASSWFDRRMRINPVFGSAFAFSVSAGGGGPQAGG